MKAEAFAKSIDELYERLRALTATKGEEYKRREDNQFANFERGAQALGLTREQVLMVYLSKHLDSITTYVKDRAANQEKQYAEPITGRIDDAILYLLLLRGMAVQNEVKAILDVMPRDPIPQHPNCRCVVEEVAVSKTTTERVGNIEVERRETIYRDPLVLDPGPAPTVGVPVIVMSANQNDAIAECNARALPAATSAICYPDQLYGRQSGHVIFIHHGNRSDDALLSEVKHKCEKQGLTHEVVYK